MTPKTPAELDSMRRGGRILGKILADVADLARPGVSLAAINRTAEKLIRKAGATPSFKGYQGYPYATCLSVNEEVVHGLPRAYRLQDGDLLGIDIGVFFDGLHTDSAVTVGVGRISAADGKLLEVTRRSLWAGILLVKPGVALGDIQAAIQRVVKEADLTVIRDLCGHGIGKRLQEEPQIPNFGKKGSGERLEVGQTFALEPMVSFHSAHTATLPDGWTVVTLDRRRSAHFEHTVAVTEVGVEVLTASEELDRFPSRSP